VLKVQPHSQPISQTQLNNIRSALAGRGKQDLPMSDTLRSQVLEICAASSDQVGGISNTLRASWEVPVLSFSVQMADTHRYGVARLDTETGVLSLAPVPAGRTWRSALLLVRHAKHAALANAGTPGEFLHGWVPRRLSENGEQETSEVAEVLANVVHTGDGVPTPIEITDLRYALSWEARATAQLIGACMQKPDVIAQPYARLDPGHMLSDFSNARALDGLADELMALASPPVGVLAESNEEAFRFFTERRVYAAVIVAHQPLLGWLAHRITGRPVPMQHSEILCIERNGRGSSGRLDWVLSPSDPQAIEDLRAKIKSKMDTAKVLSVFISAGFAFVVKAIADLDLASSSPHRLWGLHLTALFFLAAIGLYLASMYSYDSLLMPRRFWAEGSLEAAKARPAWLVARPPSPAHWVLYQNMLAVWNRQFTPATIAVLLGLLSLAYSVMALTAACPITSAVALAATGLVAVWLVLKGGHAPLRRRIGPWLGSED
jgi:phosphohistidine phosphatase SixA